METNTPRSVAGEDAGFELVAHTTREALDNSEWAKREAATAAEIYGLTDAARQWLMNDIEVVRMRGEPNWAGAWGSGFGIGHPDPWTFMHEAMHVFWGYWNGFPESCDRMNLHTFRRDVIAFMETFHALDNKGMENPLEPWRPYYDDLRRSLPDHTWEGESVAEILENEEFHKIWHYVFHLHETNPPMWAQRQPALLPPQIRRYFDGFLTDGPEEAADLTEEVLRGHRLGGVDGDLWRMAYGRYPLPLPKWATHIDAALRTGRLDETERTILGNAQRQKVVDFLNTLPDVADRGYVKTDASSDCRRFSEYIRRHLLLTTRYAAELHDAEGLEFAAGELEPVLSAWSAIVSSPLYGEGHIAEVKSAILNEPGVPSGHRDAFVDVVDMIRRYEYGGFARYRPNFAANAPFGAIVLETEPRTASHAADGPSSGVLPHGLQNVVVQIDDVGRVRLEWDLPKWELPASALSDWSYRSNFGDGCRRDDYHYELTEPAVLPLSDRQRATWSPYLPGGYQFCLELRNEATGERYEVCHGNVAIAS